MEYKTNSLVLCKKKPFKNTKLTLNLPKYPLINRESLCFFSFSLSSEDKSNGQALLLPPLLPKLSYHVRETGSSRMCAANWH